MTSKEKELREDLKKKLGGLDLDLNIEITKNNVKIGKKWKNEK